MLLMIVSALLERSLILLPLKNSERISNPRLLSPETLLPTPFNSQQYQAFGNGPFLFREENILFNFLFLICLGHDSQP